MNQNQNTDPRFNAFDIPGYVSRVVVTRMTDILLYIKEDHPGLNARSGEMAGVKAHYLNICDLAICLGSQEIIRVDTNSPLFGPIWELDAFKVAVIKRLDFKSPPQLQVFHSTNGITRLRMSEITYYFKTSTWDSYGGASMRDLMTAASVAVRNEDNAVLKLRGSLDDLLLTGENSLSCVK